MFNDIYSPLAQRIAFGPEYEQVLADAKLELVGHKPLDGEETLPAVIDTAKLAPCGFCRRCAIHDDPGGCLSVSDYERELLGQGITPREILVASMGEDFVTDAMVEGWEQQIADAHADSIAWRD